MGGLRRSSARVGVSVRACAPPAVEYGWVTKIGSAGLEGCRGDGQAEMRITQRRSPDQIRHRESGKRQ